MITEHVHTWTPGHSYLIPPLELKEDTHSTNRMNDRPAYQSSSASPQAPRIDVWGSSSCGCGWCYGECLIVRQDQGGRLGWYGFA